MHGLSEAQEPRRAGRPLIDEAVGVARGVSTLKTGLLDAQPPGSRRRGGRTADRPSYPRFRCWRRCGSPTRPRRLDKDLVPGRTQRGGCVDAAAVAADLNHLRCAGQAQFGVGGMRCAPDDPTEAGRAGLAGLCGSLTSYCLKLPGPPAGHVQPAVVDREVDVAHQRRNGAEGLQRRRQLRGARGSAGIVITFPSWWPNRRPSNRQG
jgi:hypothetical protein